MAATAHHDRIIVGVDGSEQSAHALAWAHAEAVIRGAELRVVHAWEPPTPTSEIAAMAQPDAAVYEEAANELLAEACRAIDPASPVAVEPRAAFGHPAKVLVDQAHDADLLVVGSRGRGGFASLLLGSVAHECVRHARCPVAVIHPSAPLPSPDDDVVVGIDGSAGSLRALRWAIDEAAVREARLRAVHAWSTPYPVPPAGVGLVPLDRGEFIATSSSLLHQTVDPEIASAERRPVAVDLEPIEDSAVPALLDQSKGAGALVVGSRGRGGFASLVLGSVSEQCLRHATCAVIVIPTAAAAIPSPHDSTT